MSARPSPRPGGSGRRRSRRSRRARRARAADRPGAPSSSRTRPGRRRRTRGGSPRDRTSPPARGRAACRRVQPPCSGWPANARLFTGEPRGFVVARRGTCARSCRRAIAGRIGEREGHAHLRAGHVRRRSRGRGPGVGVRIGLGAVDPVGDVPAALGRDDVDGVGEQTVEVDVRPGPRHELDRPLVGRGGGRGARTRRPESSKTPRSRPASACMPVHASSPSGTIPVAASTARRARARARCRRR